MVKEECQELVGQLPEPSGGKLVKVLVKAVQRSVLLSYYQGQLVTEVHAAVDGLAAPEETQIQAAFRRFSVPCPVGILVPFPESDIEARVTAKPRTHPHYRLKEVVEFERPVEKATDVLRRKDVDVGKTRGVDEVGLPLAHLQQPRLVPGDFLLKSPAVRPCPSRFYQADAQAVQLRSRLGDTQDALRIDQTDVTEVPVILTLQHVGHVGGNGHPQKIVAASVTYGIPAQYGHGPVDFIVGGVFGFVEEQMNDRFARQKGGVVQGSQKDNASVEERDRVLVIVDDHAATPAPGFRWPAGRYIVHAFIESHQFPAGLDGRHDIIP